MKSMARLLYVKLRDRERSEITEGKIFLTESTFNKSCNLSCRNLNVGKLTGPNQEEKIRENKNECMHTASQTRFLSSFKSHSSADLEHLFLPDSECRATYIKSRLLCA